MTPELFRYLDNQAIGLASMFKCLEDKELEDLNPYASEQLLSSLVDLQLSTGLLANRIRDIQDRRKDGTTFR